MRLLLALFVTAVSVVTVDADIRGRRAGGNRIMPYRNLRVFNGYNTRFPGYDSGYYSPYSATNSKTWTSEPAASGTIGQPTPAATIDPIPSWQPQPFPQSSSTGSTPGQPNELRSTGNETTMPSTKPTKSIRKNIPTNYQLQNQGNSYWDTLD